MTSSLYVVDKETISIDLRATKILRDDPLASSSTDLNPLLLQFKFSDRTATSLEPGIAYRTKNTEATPPINQ